MTMLKKIQVSVKEKDISPNLSLIVGIPYHNSLSCVYFSHVRPAESLWPLSYLFPNLSQ